MTELKITQADRDAAAAYYYSAGGSPKIANEIREGKKDGWFRVQAFARHRIAAEEGKAELVAAANELQAAEAEYRRCHDIFGGGHRQAGRAWDVMRRSGDRLRAALARVRGEG